MKKIAIYSSHSFEKPYLLDANSSTYELVFIDEALSVDTVPLCIGCTGIAVFTSDDVSAEILDLLKKQDIKFVAARSTGYDHVDLKQAAKLNIQVANVPAYSPNAIAEHAIALILALNRHLIQSHNKVTHFDFRIDELTGFNLLGKTVGIIGTGKIGAVVCKILYGFGCHLIGFDIKEDKSLVDKYGLQYVTLETIWERSDIITLHAPLNENTTYLVNKSSIARMKDGVMLINTSRGKLINTADALESLDSGKIASLGIDVYEKERGVFFHDYSEKGLDDALLKTLAGRDNVLMTAHHAFLTKEALKNIADTTIFNIGCFINNTDNPNELEAGS